jgi:neutral ceramidase
MQVSYAIGTGIGEVTDPAAGLPLQGMVDEDQIATGVESPLYARAFVVAERPSVAEAGCVAIIVADIWAGTHRVKDGVLRRLAASHQGVYTEENVLLAGTHTHSAPGGFSGNLLYDFNFDIGGCDEATVACIVDGCVRAVEMAHTNLAPGRIYINRGEVADCGSNRSEPAYLRNPQAERNRWGADTDREMLLLKFVKVDDQDRERPVGALSWYAIHPTDRGQKNTLVCGDNKGYASSLFEQEMHSDRRKPETFVAAFANAHCGDVSGNVEFGLPKGVDDKAHMEKHGYQQFEVAERLFREATEEVTGPVDHRHTRVDFSKVTTGAGGARTWPAALGLSFAAGSAVDSVPKPDLGIEEGRTAANLTEGDEIIEGASRVALSAVFGISLIDQATAVAEREGQLPKPVVLMPGIEEPAPVVPQVLPVQLLRVGTLAVLGIPGELTTMAGRRLRTSVLDAMSATGVAHLALGTYANEYAGYITTREEYSAQHYEGASTLFGPHTLEAHQQVAAQLATAIADGKPSPPGPAATQWTSPRQHRYRFRNLSSLEVRLRFYNKHNWLRWLPLPRADKTIKAGAENAYPEREFTWGLLPKVERFTVKLPTVKTVTVKVGNDIKRTMSAGQLLIVSADGSIAVGEYSPPPRT